MPPDDSIIPAPNPPAPSNGDATSKPQPDAGTPTPSPTSLTPEQLTQVGEVVKGAVQGVADQFNETLTPIAQAIHQMQGSPTPPEGGKTDTTVEDDLQQFWANPKNFIGTVVGESIKSVLEEQLQPALGIMAGDRTDQIMAQVERDVDEEFGPKTFDEEVKTDLTTVLAQMTPIQRSHARAVNAALAGVLGKDSERRARLAERRAAYLKAQQEANQPPAMLMGGHRAPSTQDDAESKRLVAQFVADRERHVGDGLKAEDFTKVRGMPSTLREWREEAQKRGLIPKPTQ